MSQRDRRREPYPWTWEPLAGVCMVLVVVVVLSTQVGRAAANVAAGCTLAFPPTAAGWVTTTPAVLTGNAAAGLTRTCSRAAEAATLAWCIALTAAAVLAVTVATAWARWRHWGPGVVQGMASPREVRAALGVRRLRRNRRLLRPDLYPSPRARRR